MEWYQLEVASGVNIHGRPSKMIANSCAGYPHDIRLRYGDREVDAKKMSNVLSLGITEGETLYVMVSKNHNNYVKIADFLASLIGDSQALDYK